MLPKPHRLSASHDIAKVRTEGQRVASKFTTLFVLQTDADSLRKFSFIVSKRVSKLAVHRNRTKRLLLEAVQPLLSEIKPGISVVCLAKTDLYAVPLQEIKDDIASVFHSAHIL